MPAGRCGCSRSCCPTRSGCWAPTIPTPSPPATTSRPDRAERVRPARALRLFQELLPDQERVLGADHPDTLTTRNNIAAWTGESGEAREGAAAVPAAAAGPAAGAGRRPSRDPQNAEQHRAGPGRAVRPARACGCSAAAARPAAGAGRRPSRHPHHAGQHRVATGESGEAREALRLFQQLLPDQERVLGPDHPHTRTTLNHIGLLSLRLLRERGRRVLSRFWTRVRRSGGRPGPS